MRGFNIDTMIDTADLTNLDHWQGTLQDLHEFLAERVKADLRCREMLERVRSRFDVPVSHYARTLIANWDCTTFCEYASSRQIVQDYVDAFRRCHDLLSGVSPYIKNSPYLRSLNSLRVGRSLFVTEKGRIGMGPRSTKPGDHVCIIFQSRCRWIMRKTSKPRNTAY